MTKTRIRHPGHRLIIVLLAIGGLILGLLSTDLFAMYRIGDAFIAWTGVELNGKLYPPDAGKGLGWSFWVDPDLPYSTPYYTVYTTRSFVMTKSHVFFVTKTYTFGTKTYTKIHTGTFGAGYWTTLTITSRVEKHSTYRPSPYPKPGSPECGGTADLNIRSVSGRGLYVTDSGFLVQVIEVKGQWVDTSYQVRCFGNNWCSRPCGEEIGDAWIYVKLDKEKFRGGFPIYVEVSDKSVEDWMRFAESETKVIEKLKREGNERLRFLGHVEGGEIQSQVPFAWFPENSTLKFKLTGLMKVMQDYGAIYNPIHYYVYIAPPGNKMFKPVVKTFSRARTHYGVAYWECSAAAKDKGWKVLRYRDRVCVIGTTWHRTYYKLVEAEATPETVTTTMTKIVMRDDVIKTETYTTTMTVNKLVEKTVTLEKTTTKTVSKLIEKKMTITTTVPGTTVTVEAPKTTYIITDSHQAQAVAEAYKPPKSLLDIIYEKLLELYHWLLDVLGLR